MPRVLLLLETAFSIWLLVDAIRRGRAAYWYLVIMMPFGELFYFFMVKIHDPDMRWLKDAFKRVTTKPEKVEQLRFRLDEAPSFTNTLTLAQGLYDKESYGEAADLFTRALGIDPESKDAHYGLGLCAVAVDDYEPAIDHLRRVIELDPKFHDYGAWSNLAYALTQTGRKDETLELLSKLVDTSPRLSHRLLYAHYLMQEDGRRDQAREQIRTGLQEHQNAPPFLKRRHRGYARQAKRMLRQLGI
jgi:hypothetical protein